MSKRSRPGPWAPTMLLHPESPRNFAQERWGLGDLRRQTSERGSSRRTSHVGEKRRSGSREEVCQMSEGLLRGSEGTLRGSVVVPRMFAAVLPGHLSEHGCSVAGLGRAQAPGRSGVAPNEERGRPPRSALLEDEGPMTQLPIAMARVGLGPPSLRRTPSFHRGLPGRARSSRGALRRSRTTCGNDASTRERAVRLKARALCARRTLCRFACSRAGPCPPCRSGDGRRADANSHASLDSRAVGARRRSDVGQSGPRAPTVVAGAGSCHQNRSGGASSLYLLRPPLRLLPQGAKGPGKDLGEHGHH